MKNILFVFFLFISASSFGQIKWNRVDNQSPAKQFEQDDKIFMETLFPTQTQNMKKVFAGLDQKNQKRYFEKNSFIKKIFLLMAGGGLQYSPTDNNFSGLKPWPFPLASALSHGQRVLLIFKGVDEKQIFNFITNGNSLEVAKSRIAASHDVELGKDGNPKEIKLKGAVGGAQNIMDGMAKNHWGVSVPLGGLGNITPLDLIIGESGHLLSKDFKPVKDTQHGHFYFRIDDFKKNGLTTLLVGMESGAPGKTNWFGEAHTAQSGMEDPTKKLSPTGGQKWKAMKLINMPPAPAEYGGKIVTFELNEFRALESKIQKFISDESKHKSLFDQLLMLDGVKAKELVDKI